MTNITFKAVRTVYMENGKSKETVKIYQTYAQAKAYAKRYSKITASKATSRQKFINVSIYINTDDYKYHNVDIYTIDSNEFEIEHLEQIEKFKMDNQETVKKEAKQTEKEVKYLVKGMNGFEFKTSDLQEAKKSICNESSRNPEVEYAVIELKENGGWEKVLVEGKISNPEQREKIMGFVWERPPYEVEEYVFDIATEDEAMSIAKELANKRSKVIKVYKNGEQIAEVKPDEQVEQETAEEPTEKVVGFRVGLGGKIYRTEAEAFKNNPKDAKQVFKVVDNGDGLTWEYIPIEKPAPHIKTMQEWEDSRKPFTSFCQVGELVDEEIVRYFINVLPPETWRKDLVQFGEPYGHVENPKTGGYEATYITFAKNDNGQWYYAGVCFLNQREAIA